MNEVYNVLLPLATNDYQNRDGNYPKSGVTDSIYVSSVDIAFSFKNTSESIAKRWVINFLAKYNLEVDETNVAVVQSGDYTNDWVDVSVLLRHIRLIQN